MVAPSALLADTKKANNKTTTDAADFASQWHHWPNIRWVGPEYWGNRLQDWELQDGRAVCVVTGKNRTLHCLTCQLSDRMEVFEVSVQVHLFSKGRNAGMEYVGIRLGAKGPFADYRSATVFGKGLDTGITAAGDLFIGDRKVSASLSPSGTCQLILRAEPRGGAYRIHLAAKSADGDRQLAEMEVGDIPRHRLTGNIALISHFLEAEKTAELYPSAAFADWKISGTKVDHHPDQVFGPVCFAQYTLHNKVLKLTAQLTPIETIAGHRVTLEIKPGDSWDPVQDSRVDGQGRIARFRADNWAYEQTVPYRVRVQLPLGRGTETYFYEGSIAGEPVGEEGLKAAVFSCNGDFGFPDTEVGRHVAKHRPDLALFLGDQFYESTGGFGIETAPLDRATLDYLRKWYMFGWSYRDIFRHIPAAIIPDDHDAYHGNVWGEGGKAAPTNEGWNYVAQDQGGYKMPAAWVNMMQQTQTSHLPDPYDPTPVEQGIGVYYTNWNYGGVGFAILEDRKFKTAPKNALPGEANVLNGFTQNRDFDIKAHYDIDADLLGDRQLHFLEEWSKDWKQGIKMKAVLSQTNFCTVATLPQGSVIDSIVPKLPVPKQGEYIPGDAPTADMDSNGWPQRGRDEALKLIRKCFAFHIAGDQHLASMVHYGIEEFGDAGYAFAGPALNNIFPRRWWPPVTENHRPLNGQPAYTGDFFDGFGNRMTIHAVANPRQTNREPAIIYDRSTGYGIVTFDKEAQSIQVECWPRYADPEKELDGQYQGWPMTIAQQDNYARKAIGYLPELQLENLESPVVEIIDQENGELVYSLRVESPTFKPKVFNESTYLMRVGDPDTGIWREFSDLKPSEGGEIIACVF